MEVSYKLRGNRWKFTEQNYIRKATQGTKAYADHSPRCTYNPRLNCRL
uniref:Uncharacterized protein n=1 Tax=Arundo donax TaxID=35708 RepID=A0A0A9BPI5_ARUDO